MNSRVGHFETGATPKGKRYWRTPPELLERIRQHFPLPDKFFDPCPCPKPAGYDSLKVEWGQVNYVNPPFRRADGVDGKGVAAFINKAIEEQTKGKTSVFVLPVPTYVNALLKAGAEAYSCGNIHWLEADSLEPNPHNSTVAMFVLRGKEKATGAAGN